MIAFFRNNLFINSLLLLPYALLLRSHSLWKPVAYTATEEDTFMVQWFFGMITDPLGQAIFAAVLVFLQAYAINSINNKNRLTRQMTLLAGLGYIVLTSFLPEYEGLSPVLLANSFLIWGFIALFNIYKKPNTAIQLFNAGLAMGLAMLFVPSLSIMLLFGIISLITLKAFNLRDALQNIVGFGSALYLTYGVIYLGGADITKELDHYFYSFQYELFSGVVGHLRIFLLVGVLILLSIVGYNNAMVKKSIEVQKKIDLLYWALLLSLFAVLLSQQLSYDLAHIMFVPASLLLGITFGQIKNHSMAETLHLATVVAIFLLHFYL